MSSISLGNFNLVRSINLDEWQNLKAIKTAFDTPLVIRQGMISACLICPELISDNYPDVKVKASMNLPNTGVPYCIRDSSHTTQVSLAAFVSMLKAGAAGYVNQLNARSVLKAVGGVNMAELQLEEVHAINLWIGRSTKSGLHFDFANNVLIQAYGTKRAVLIDPKFSANIYAFCDVPSKSQVDPEAPDLTNFPLFARCTLLDAVLAPGDVLYVDFR